MYKADTFISKACYNIGLFLGIPLLGPRKAFIKIFDKCNLHCVFCPISHKAQNKMLTFDELKKLILNLKELRTKIVELSADGEPFLNPKIWKIIEYIKSLGLECDITTNGLLLNRSNITKLIKLEVRKLTVSINAATEETYRSIQRKSKQQLREVIKNLLLIKSLKAKYHLNTPRVWSANVICGKNYLEIEDMISLAGDINAEFVIFKHLVRQTKNLDKLKLSENAKNYLASNANSYVTKAEELNLRTNLKWFTAQNRGIMPSRCATGVLFTRITPNGDVNPCYGIKTFGNIKERPFNDIWLSKQYREFRKRSEDTGWLLKHGFDCDVCILSSFLSKKNRML